MDDQLELTCPCCDAALVVDRVTGQILWHKAREQKASGKSLEEMVKTLESQKAESARKLDRELESQKDRARVLEARFREAMARADRSDKKPVNPFDLD